MKILGIDISRERKPKPGDETYYGKLPNGGTKVKYTNKPKPSYIRLSEKNHLNQHHQLMRYGVLNGINDTVEVEMIIK